MPFFENRKDPHQKDIHFCSLGRHNYSSSKVEHISTKNLFSIHIALCLTNVHFQIVMAKVGQKDTKSRSSLNIKMVVDNKPSRRAQDQSILAPINANPIESNLTRMMLLETSGIFLSTLS